jgi:hypothetical protein
MLACCSHSSSLGIATVSETMPVFFVSDFAPGRRSVNQSPATRDRIAYRSAAAAL